MLIADNHYTAKNIRNFEVSVFELIISVQAENWLLSVLSLSAEQQLITYTFLYIAFHFSSFFFFCTPHLSYYPLQTENTALPGRCSLFLAGIYYKIFFTYVHFMLYT